MEKKIVKVKISDIYIKESFKRTKPRFEKMKKYRDYYREHHSQLKNVVLDKRNVLVDGYIQYLVFKEMGEKYISADKEIKVEKVSEKKQKRNKLTTYIYGIHPTSKTKKEFVWRVPDSWVDWENDLLPGDQILVRTVHGVKPIVITRIEWLCMPPVDGTIRKVYKKMDK